MGGDPMSRIVVPLPDDASDSRVEQAKTQVRALLNAGCTPAEVQRFVDLMAPLTEPRPMPSALRYGRRRTT